MIFAMLGVYYLRNPGQYLRQFHLYSVFIGYLVGYEKEQRSLSFSKNGKVKIFLFGFKLFQSIICQSKGFLFITGLIPHKRENIQVLYVNVHCQIIQLLQEIILNIKMHKVQVFSVSATITKLLIRCLNLLQNNSAGKEIKGS